ncbi:FAD-dependent oxidoreductase, partial [Eubacteriales bacterium OttesenSCG-928-A19]|nr:FAD-dependent oxidoreductase [Eubacteriales bacterium OttesenSCG-928-A19]
MHNLRELEYDVVVIGGGAGGLCAAIAAARKGARTVLVERTAVLGGCAASGLSILGFMDRSGAKVLGGLPQELYDRLAEMDGTTGHFPCPVHNSISPISAQMFKILAVELCREAGVDILFNCDVTDVQVVGGRIRAVTVYGKCTDIRITGRQFVDGTGDGDMAYLAGCSFSLGQEDEGRVTDGVPVMQPSTLMFTIAGHDLEAFYRWTEDNPSELGIKEEYAEGYDLDFFRSTVGHCLIGLTETIRKARANGDFTVPRNQFIYIKTASEALLANNTSRIINIDASDPFQLSAGVEEGYAQIHQLLRFMRKYVPGFENAVIADISPTLGIRETRHFHGIYRLTKAEMYAGERREDTVALCGYNVDIHAGTADHIDLTPLEKAFGLPYGCFVARDVENLFLAGRTL